MADHKKKEDVPEGCGVDVELPDIPGDNKVKLHNAHDSKGDDVALTNRHGDDALTAV